MTHRDGVIVAGRASGRLAGVATEFGDHQKGVAEGERFCGDAQSTALMVLAAEEKQSFDLDAGGLVGRGGARSVARQAPSAGRLAVSPAGLLL